MGYLFIMLRIQEGLAPTRQVVYHWATPQPPCVILFLDKSYSQIWTPKLLRYKWDSVSLLIL